MIANHENAPKERYLREAKLKRAFKYGAKYFLGDARRAGGGREAVYESLGIQNVTSYGRPPGFVISNSRTLVLIGLFFCFRRSKGMFLAFMNYQAKTCINLASKPIINTMFGLVLKNKFYYLSVMKMKYGRISVM